MYELGYFGLFLASFLSATIIPFSSEAILSSFLVGGYPLYKCIAVATMGNWFGSIATFWLGYIGDWKKIVKWLKVPQKKAERFQPFVEKYKYVAAFLCWLPFIGDLFALILGLMRTNFYYTAFFILIGKILRYSVWAFITLKAWQIF